MVKIKRKEKLQGRIEFRVTAATEEGYKILRSKNFEIQEALRIHAENLISRIQSKLKEEK